MFINRFIKFLTGILTLLLILPGCGGSSGDADYPAAPTVSFTMTPDTADPQLVSFHAIVSGGLGPFSIGWDFKHDGVAVNIMAAGEDVSYRYSAPGTYTVLCQVSDAIPSSQDPDHRPVTALRTITVEEGTYPPPDVVISVCEASATMDYTGHFVVDVTGGMPFEEEPHYLITWDFDYDGIPSSFDNMASGTNVLYTYPESGAYTVGVKVNDSMDSGIQPGRPVIVTCNVDIPNPEPPLPDIVLSWELDGIHPTIVHFNAVVSGGVPMSPPDPLYGIQWDFDYQVGGNFDAMAAGSSVSYEYPSPGTYVAACLVWDSIPPGAGGRPVIEWINVNIPW